MVTNPKMLKENHEKGLVLGLLNSMTKSMQDSGN